MLPCGSRSVLLMAWATVCVLPVAALNPEHKISQYLHTAWKSDAGVQAVRRIKQTPDGYLWLATRGGLVRFDGVRFSTYLAGSVEGLESSTMQDLLVDRDGSLWIATLGGGVAHFQHGKFHSYTSRDGLPSDDVNALHQDAHGVLWVGTREGKIARLQQDRFEEVSLGMAGSRITAFVEDVDQSLWIATFGNGVFRLRSGILTAFSVKDGLPNDKVSDLCRDHSGKIWTAGWNGLSSWNGTRFVRNPTFSSAVSNAIRCTEDRDRNLWIASSSGVLRAQPGTVTKLDRDSGLSGDFASDVFEDREGNVWVGTRSGLDRLRDASVRTFSHREGLVQTVGPLVAANDGAIWTVSAERIARIAANEISEWHLPVLSRGAPRTFEPRTLLSQPDSQFLIGFDRGVMRWSRQRCQLVPETAGLDVRCLLKARDGSIWIGTANRGLLQWKTTAGSRTLHQTPVADKFIAALAEDHDGAIWAGSNSGTGLYRVAGQQVQNFGRAEGLRSPYIFTLFVDGKGDLWIGSMGGLSWFQDGRLRTASSQQGLPADQVFAILDDSYNRLWFTTIRGIASVEKNSLTEWATGRRRRLSPTIYQSVEPPLARTVPNAVRSVDGHLWFGVADGISEVKPPSPGASHSGEFQVLIEEVVVDGVSHLREDRLRIPPGSRSVELGYTALTLSSPETVRFRYRLEGVDKNWMDVDSRRTAFYNNLKPGAYTFRVAARARDGQWQEASAMMLEQLPFFYQTSWFMLLASATVVSLVFLAYRVRVQQAVDRIQAGFQERMDERARIAQELHDTVVQAISGSTMLVETAAERVPDSMPVVKGTLLRAVDRLDFALAESRAALKGLRGSTMLENDLAEQLSAVACDANNREIAFELVITGESRDIHPMIRNEVFRIGSEAIGNAFKHSDATSIRVELAYANAFRISVRDDGKGIPPEVLDCGRDGHFGLECMRERAGRIRAKLAVYSRVGQGTEVNLIVPANIAFDAGSTKRPRS
jgi:ligand-binding sensor domain-containing protein/signal transduction histidine kinase